MSATMQRAQTKPVRPMFPKTDYQQAKRLVRRNYVLAPRGKYLTEGIRQGINKALLVRGLPAIPAQAETLALLIAAHNEEMVLGNTLRSAIAAGMDPHHIYVVDDNSSDATSHIARSILPAGNVHRVGRSGKGLAIAKAARRFKLTERYQWIHIADADGAYSPDYFEVFRAELNGDCAAATGYMRSMQGGYISQFRAFEYTVGMEIHRRFQSMFNVIPIIPGPTSCFRAKVFEQLNFSNGSLTEDFDVTLQIHRKGLGRIQFIPGAVAYTQDPRTLRDFVKQITRWNRGVMQGVSQHKIGRRASPIDAYITYQVLQNFLVFINYFVWVPYLALFKSGPAALAVTFIFDVMLTLAIAGLVCMRLKRPEVIAAFPLVYALRWVALFVFMKAFIEVSVLRKYLNAKGIWDNKGRRYQVGATV